MPVFYMDAHFAYRRIVIFNFWLAYFKTGVNIPNCYTLIYINDEQRNGK